MKKDVNTVNELMKILETDNLTEITYEEEGFKIFLKRDLKREVQPVVATKTVKNIKEKNEVYLDVVSSGIGKFYSKQNKAGETALKIGAIIAEGEEIGYISTMGVKSSITSDFSGKIVEVCVNDGDIVDFNKTILKLKK